MLFERIARLASLALQERFITHATAQNYYVVEELLGTAAGVVDGLLGIEVYARSLSEANKEALLAFDEVLRREGERVDLSSGDLVHADPAWQQIRMAASECLAQVGFDVPAFEARELDEARQSSSSGFRS
jgi:hypothetical protein